MFTYIFSVNLIFLFLSITYPELGLVMDCVFKPHEVHVVYYGILFQSVVTFHIMNLLHI